MGRERLFWQTFADPAAWHAHLMALSRSPADFLAASYYNPPRLTSNLEQLLDSVLGSPAYRSFLDDGGFEAMRHAFDDLRVPTLIVGGREDGMVPLDAMRAAAAHVPGAHFEVLARCGHFPSIEQPSELHFTIQRFLQTRARTAQEATP